MILFLSFFYLISELSDVRCVFSEVDEVLPLGLVCCTGGHIRRKIGLLDKGGAENKVQAPQR